MSYWTSSHTCCNCGQSFKASRRDAKYCSARCRKQISLERKKLRSLQKTAISSIKSLQAYFDNPEFSHDAAESVAEIEAVLNFTHPSAAAAPAARSGAAAITFVPALDGTDESFSSKSVATGSDTSSPVQLNVNREYQQLCEKLDRLEAAINWDIRQLQRRIDELEEATDWSKVS